ncbi:hypothetical protein [Coleofasciculus sp.]
MKFTLPFIQLVIEPDFELVVTNKYSGSPVFKVHPKVGAQGLRPI